MRNKRNKYIALIVSLIMLFDFVPLSAFAEELVVVDVSESQTVPVMPDPEETEEPEEEFWEEVISKHIDDYTVTVTVTKEAEFPVGTTVTINPLDSNDYRNEAATHFDRKDNELGSFIRVFDITFWYDGMEIEPLVPVDVKVTFDNAVELEGNNELKLIHLHEDEAAKEIEAETETAETEEAAAIESLSFQSDKFSTYIVAEEIVVYTFSESGNNYEVVLKCNSAMGIPQDAVFTVEEITKESDLYDQYAAQVAAVINPEGGVRMPALLDISLKTADGEKIQLDNKVQVIVRLTDENVQRGLQVVHFPGEDPFQGESAVRDAVANNDINKEEIEILDIEHERLYARLNTKENTVTFNTDSFSVFALAYTVDFHYVDEQGETYEWSYPGRGKYALTDILETVHITGTPTAATLTLVEGEEHAGALYLTKEDEDWFLNSDIAFTDTYQLKVTVNGKVYVMRVTDSASHAITIMNNTGNAIEIGNLFVVYEMVEGGTHYYNIEKITSSGVIPNNGTINLTVSSFHEPYQAGNPSKCRDYISGQELSVYMAYGPTYGGNPQDYNENFLGNNNNGVLYYTTSENSLPKYYNQSESYNYSIVTDKSNDSTTITFGTSGPIAYKATFNFYNESGVRVDTPSLSGNYYLVTKVADEVYHSQITGSTNTTAIVFSDASESATNDLNLTDAASFKIVSGTVNWNSFDFESAVPVTAIGEYTHVVTNNLSGNVHTITASKPRTCTAGLSFKDTGNNPQPTPSLEEGYNYYVVTVKNGTPAGYAPFTASNYSSPLSFTGSTPDDDETTTIWIVRSVTALTDVSDIAGIDAENKVTTSDEILGNYLFTWSRTGTNYTITGTEKDLCNIVIGFYEADGTTDLTTSAKTIDGSYYVFAKNSSNQVKYYAPVNNDTIGIFKNTSDQEVSYLEGVAKAQLAKYKGSIGQSDITYGELMRADQLDWTYSTGPVGNDDKYTIDACEPTPINHTIELKLKLRPRIYSLAISYNPSNPTLDGDYYLLIKERGSYKYYIKMTNGGFDWNTRKNTDGSQPNNLESAYGFTFEMVKWTGSSDPNNINAFSGLTRINTIGGTAYNSTTNTNDSVSYVVNLANPTVETTTYTFTATVTTTRTAAFRFYDKWSTDPNTTVNLVSGQTLTATIGSDIYTASITGTGDLNFTLNDQPAELPEDLPTWKLNGKAIVSGTTKIGDYVVTGLTLTDGKYVFKARQPNTYTASLIFENAAGTQETPASLDSGYYLVINNNIYASVTENGLENWEGNSGTELPEIESFKFVKCTGTVSSVNDLTGLTAETKIGDYDILTTTIPTPDGSHNYAFEAKLPTIYTAKINVDEASGLEAGSYYYVVARRDGTTNIGYAQFSTSGETSLEFKNGNEDVQLVGNISFWIVKSSAELTKVSEIDSLDDKVTTTGGELGVYAFTLPSTANGTVFELTATRQQIYSLSITFAPGTDIVLGTEGYYLLVKCGGTYKYYAKLTDTEFTGLKKAADDSPVTTGGITQASSFEFVKTDNANPSFADLQGLTKISNGGTIGEYYTVEIPVSATGSEYVFTATKQAHTVSIRFKNAENTDVTTLALDNYYYLVAKINGERKYFAHVTGNDNQLSFTDENGTSNLEYLPDVTFELVKSNEKVMTLSGLPLETVNSFMAGATEYSLGIASKTTSAYSFMPKEATEPTDFTVEIRMLNDQDVPTQPSQNLPGNNYKLITVMILDGGKVATTESDNMNPGCYTEGIKSFTYDKIGNEPYTPGARVEVYLGPDISWNSETQTINNPGNAIKEGSVIGDYQFSVTKEKGKISITGRPLTPHTVNVQFDGAPSENWQVYAEEVRNGKTYKATSDNLSFDGNFFATKEFTSLTADSNGGTIAVSDKTQYYVQKENYLKYGNGSVDTDNKAYTVTTLGDTTTITRGSPREYPYSIQAVRNDGTMGTGSTPELNNEEWYVKASVVRSDGTYSNVAKISGAFSSDTFTNQISVFYREADKGNSGNAVRTAYIPGEHVSFALLRPASTATDPYWAYFANTANINYNGLNGSSIEGKYTLSIAETTTSGSERTDLKLVEGPAVNLSFAAHEGATKDTAIETPSDLLNPGTGKYFIFARMSFGDGVKRRTGFYVTDLSGSSSERTSYAISNGFSVNRAESGQTVSTAPYYITGDRIFDSGLVYTPNSNKSAEQMLAELNQYEVSTQIGAANSGSGIGKPYTLYSHSQAAGGYRLISVEGSRTSTTGTLDLVKLPMLTVTGEVRKENGAVATTFNDADNHYYVLAELVQNGVKSYAYASLNTTANTNGITTDSATLNEYVCVSSDANNGRKYFYVSGDTVNWYVIKSATEITTVTDAAAAPRFAAGQQMGLYTPSFEKDGNNTLAVLTEQTPPTGQAHTVNIQLYDYDKTTKLGIGENEKSITELPYRTYSVLAYLTPKGTGAKGQVIGWWVQKAKVTTNDTDVTSTDDILNSVGHTELTIPQSGFKICDANGEPITYTVGDSPMVGYDPDLFDLTVRLYHGSNVMTSYNDRYAETDPSTHTPVYSDNAPDGYDFMDALKTPDSTTIRLNSAYTKSYSLKLKIIQIDETGISFHDSDNYWAVIQLNHKSGAPTFAFAQLTDVIVTNSAGEEEFTLSLYEKEGKVWFNSGNGNPEMTMENGFTGNEESVTFQIVKAEGDSAAFGNISKGYGGVHVKVGESVGGYTLSVGERSRTEDLEKHTVTIIDTIVLTEDLNGIKKGEIDTVIAQAREFGLYTEILSKHATDMEANIGADRVTGPIGADYGFSNNNIMVNRLKVVKKFLDASNEPLNNKQVALGLFDALTGEQVGSSIQKTTGADNMTVGVAEFEFTDLQAGKYILKEYINNEWYSYQDVDSPISYEGGNLTVDFADGEITMRDINSDVNYFGTIEIGDLETQTLLRHSRQGTVVTDNSFAKLRAVDPEQLLASTYQTGTMDYPKTYNIPADMDRLRALSIKLADSTSSKTVRVMNMKLSEIPSGGLAVTGDGRYIVLNIDVTGCGSWVNVFTRVNYDGRNLNPDFGSGGREDSSKILWNFYIRDASGNAHPYGGHIDTASEGAGVLLAPSAVVGDLGGNWGGTIICHEAQHSGSEIHSDNPNKIVNISTMLTNSLSTTKLGNLTIQKVIVGDTRDRTTWFTFEITLKDAAGTNPMANQDEAHRTFIASGLKEGRTVTFDTNGKATIKVRAENQVTISGLTDGWTYHVEEKETEESEFYQLVHIENGDGFVTPDGTIKGGRTVLVKAINIHKVGGLTIRKTVAGIDTTQEFEFQVTIMAAGSASDPASDVNGIHGGMNFENGVATFKLGNGEHRTIEASEIPMGRKFKVEELDHDKELNGKLFVTDVTVKTTGGVVCQVNSDDSVTGTISDDKNAIIVSYTNTYNNGTVYQPKVTKNLEMNNEAVEDAKWPEEGFTFTLTAAANNPEGSEITGNTAIATAAGKTATFGTIQFNYDGEPWERIFHYIITEVEGNAPGITYHTDPLNLWICVNLDTTTDPSNPVLVIEGVQYGGASYEQNRQDKDAVDEATGTITNQMTEVSAHPSGTKRLTGRDWEAGETFQFTLMPDVFTLNKIGKTVILPQPGAGDNFTVNVETKTITLTVHKLATGNDQNFNFPNITFKAPGTYSFVMEEVGRGTTVDGLTYSNKRVKVQFNVLQSAVDNTLTLDNQNPVYTVISGAQEGDTTNNTLNLFINNYESNDVYYTPSVTKSLLHGSTEADGDLWPEEGFTFKLDIDAGNPIGAVVPSNHNATATKDQKTASFEEIKFTKTGTFKFIISEIEPAGTENHVKDNITYSQEKVYLIVTVGKVDENDDKLKIDSAVYRMNNPDSGSEGSTITNTIPNESGVELPATGGPGTALYTFLGLMILLLAGGLLVFNKRRGARENK